MAMMDRLKKMDEKLGRPIQAMIEASMLPKIIAMKGHPRSGKSSVAKELARELKCPFISIDDVMTSFHQPPLESTSQSTPTKHLFEQSFDAICRIASNQLKAGTTRLILDSPLSSPAHLYRLMQISAGARIPLVVVDCKPKDKYQWKLWVDNESKWEEIEELLLHDQQRGDFSEGLVAKLTLDTTRNYFMDLLLCQVTVLAVCAFVSPVANCFDHHAWSSVAENGMTVEGGVIKTKDTPRDASKIKDDTTCGHRYLHLASEYGREVGQTCLSCQKPVLAGSPAYFCPECSFSFHKTCAELPNRKEIHPRDHPVFLKEIPNDRYIFRQEVKCASCQLEPTYEVKDCRRCILESYARSAEFPMVLQHPCHEHLLRINPIPLSISSMFKCHACGDPGKNIRYSCHECLFEYHLTCCLLPHTGKEMHHLHNLTITTSPLGYDPDEDFICNACETYRNPKDWFYHCGFGCQFVCHIQCMTFEKED